MQITGDEQNVYFSACYSKNRQYAYTYTYPTSKVNIINSHSFVVQASFLFVFNSTIKTTNYSTCRCNWNWIGKWVELFTLSDLYSWLYSCLMSRCAYKPIGFEIYRLIFIIEFWERFLNNFEHRYLKCERKKIPDHDKHFNWFQVKWIWFFSKDSSVAFVWDDRLNRICIIS